jgi:DNA-binding CsgD family transcriptional regulator
MSPPAWLDGCPEFLPRTDVRADALSATLDSLTTGIVVVADRGRILHANTAARRMLSARKPIAAVNGILSVRDASASRKLASAIASAKEATIASGIGVALRSREPAIAFVLPLAHGNLGGQTPAPTAAVFVTEVGASPPADIAALAESFGLTPAETRTLEHLVRGATVADTAAALGVSMATAKTHLVHIFSKTGISRQADLLALVHRLLPPIHGARTSDDQSERHRPATGEPGPFNPAVPPAPRRSLDSMRNPSTMAG